MGRRVREVKVLGSRTVRRQSPAELTAALQGRRLTKAGRRGKFLLMSLDDGAVLVVHLRMTGQLLHLRGGRRPPLAPHTHVVVVLGDGSELRFVDPRTFGEWFVTTEVDDRGVPCELAHVGRDPLLEGLPTAYLAALSCRPPCPARGPAHRPAPGRGHREHLRGRDLLSGKAQARPLRWLAKGDRGRCSRQGGPGGAARGGSSARVFFAGPALS